MGKPDFVELYHLEKVRRKLTTGLNEDTNDLERMDSTNLVLVMTTI